MPRYCSIGFVKRRDLRYDFLHWGNIMYMYHITDTFLSPYINTSEPTSGYNFITDTILRVSDSSSTISWCPKVTSIEIVCHMRCESKGKHSFESEKTHKNCRPIDFGGVVRIAITSVTGLSIDADHLEAYTIQLARPT